MKTAFNGEEGGVFNGGGSVRRQRQWGLRIGNDKATMENDISGGGWRRRASAFDGGDGGRFNLRLKVAMDGSCGSGG